MSPLKPQQVDRGQTLTAAAAPSATAAALIREEQARIAAERQLVQRMQELHARVAVLEQLVARLAGCAVQQHWDGRLYLPSSSRLTLDVKVNGMPFAIEATPRRTTIDPPVGSSWPLPQSPVDVSRPRPMPAPSSQPSSSNQLSSSAPSRGGWQSQAVANGQEDPRRVGGGNPLTFR